MIEFGAQLDELANFLWENVSHYHFAILWKEPPFPPSMSLPSSYIYFEKSHKKLGYSSLGFLSLTSQKKSFFY